MEEYKYYWINVEKTILEFNIDPRILSMNSSKKILKICQKCNKEYHTNYQNAIKHPVCRKCLTPGDDGVNKKCNYCKEIKLLDDFGNRYDRKNGKAKKSRCKKCDTIISSEYKNKYYTKNPDKKEILDLKKKKTSKIYNSLPHRKLFGKLKQREIKSKFKNYVNQYLENNFCIDCGLKDIEVLTFDHINGEKLFNIGDLKGSPKDYQKFNEEVKKCVVRCINCHESIEKQRLKSRLYCYINNVDYKFEAYKPKKLPDNPTVLQIWRFNNAERLSLKGNLKREKYFEKYLPSFIKILETGCVDCNKYFPLSMQFDHLPIYKKNNKISDLFFCWQRPWQEVLNEIYKCELLCGNCHRKRTNKRLKEKMNNE